MDAALHPNWTDTHETANVMPITTIGFLLDQDDDRVLKVAQSSNGDIRFSAIQTIPTTCVLSMRVLKKGKKLCC